MRKSEFNKFLSSLAEEELREEMGKLFDNVSGVKEYYAMELGSAADRKKIFESAKKKIDRYYATKSYRKPKAPRIRYLQALLREMHQLSVFPHETVDLYLYDVEKALDFLDEYYFYSKTLFNHLEKSFSTACDLIGGGRYQEMFSVRVERIMFLAGKHREIYREFNDAFIKTFRR